MVVISSFLIKVMQTHQIKVGPKSELSTRPIRDGHDHDSSGTLALCLLWMSLRVWRSLSEVGLVWLHTRVFELEGFIRSR
jgi:hypothetical protein